MPLTLRPAGLSSPAYRDWLDEDRHSKPELRWFWSITVTDCDESRARGVTRNARTLTERDVSHRDPFIALIPPKALVVVDAGLGTIIYVGDPVSGSGRHSNEVLRVLKPLVFEAALRAIEGAIGHDDDSVSKHPLSALARQGSRKAGDPPRRVGSSSQARPARDRVAGFRRHQLLHRQS